MESIAEGQEIKAVFVINNSSIYVSCNYTGQYSEYKGDKIYWFENTKTGTEYPFNKKELESFADAQIRHKEEVINF